MGHVGMALQTELVLQMGLVVPTRPKLWVQVWVEMAVRVWAVPGHPQ